MIIDILTIIGLTIVITTSSITKPLREWVAKKSLFFGELLGCSLCTGFWVGLTVCLCPLQLKIALSYMAIGSVSSQLVHLIIKRLQIR